MSDTTVVNFIEAVERDVARWQAEGLSAAAALNQSWAVAVLDLEAAGVLPVGYLRCRLDESECCPANGDDRQDQKDGAN